MSGNELHIAFADAGQIMAAGIVLPLVGMSVVALRFWLRYAQKLSFGMDDWSILGALVFITAMGISVIYGVSQKTLGYPSPPFPSLDAELFQVTPKQRLTELLLWLTWVLMIPGNGLIKISAVMLYRRIFVVGRWSAFDIVTQVTLVLCTVWTIAFFFATIFGCGLHVDDSWAPLAVIGSCNTNKRLEALVTTDLATDIFVWALPMIPVWGLNMKTSQKAYVTGIFALSAVSLVAAIVRLIIETEIMNGGYAATTNADLTLGDLIYWSMIESGLALIAACLPTLRVLLTYSPVKSALSSVRSTLKLNSFKSPFGSKATTLSNPTGYSEISAITKISQTSSRTEAYVNMTDDEENMNSIPLAPVAPVRAYIHSHAKSKV